MSFPKITDSEKRDFIIGEFLKTKQNLKRNVLSERMGESSTQYELSKLFKPITDTKKKLKENIVSEMKPIREVIQKAITFPQFPSILAQEDSDDDDDQGTMHIGDIAEKYLRQFASTSGADETFGLHDKNGKFFIGIKETGIKEQNFIVGGREYKGTPGLWEQMVSTAPDDRIYTPGDYENYKEIMVNSHALYRNNDENETRPIANKSRK